MACDSEIYRVDTLTVDGEVIGIEDGTATIEGAARFETEAVLAPAGDDATTRKRVPCIIKTKILFKGDVEPTKFSNMCNVQIVLANLHTGRRVRAGKCRFQALGEIGAGTVDLSFNVLSSLQWL
jgi:hypothetical protein